MTQETPGKILSLLGIAMFSMAFLFFVSVSDASFSGTPAPVPSPFDPSAVISFLDNSAAGYSSFLEANLFEPAREDLAYYHDNLAWVIDNSDYAILNAVGLSKLAAPPGNLSAADNGKVAGAYTNSRPDTRGHSGFSVDTLFSVLSLK